MTLLSLLALVPPILIGQAIVTLLWPGGLRSSLALQLLVGAGAGLGLDSLLYFLWSRAFNPADPAFLWVEIALAAVLAIPVAIKVWRQRHDTARSIAQLFNSRSWLGWGLAGLLLGLAGFSALAFMRSSFSQPYGTFDAYAIWNLRARFMYLDGAEWTRAFSPLLNWKNHADYPLLQPLNVLRLWELLGNLTLRAPMTLSLVFTFSLAGMLFAAPAAYRDISQGALGGLILLGTPGLFATGLAQTADIPLSFYFLASLAIIYAYAQDSSPGWLALAGITTGLAAWTKNEGLIFMLALAIVLAISHFRRLGRLWPFLAGLAFPLAVMIYFKISLAPPGDIVQGQSSTGILAKLLTLSRYWIIAKAFAGYLWSTGGWILPVLLILLVYALVLRRKLARREKIGLGMITSAAGLTLLGYAAIYLITPHPLEWHLQYSASRLIFQLFPLFLFMALLSPKSPQEVWGELTDRRQVFTQDDRKVHNHSVGL
jgi:hypothetical protein